MASYSYFENLLARLLPTQNKCLNYLMEGDTEMGIKEGLMIYKQHPQYLLLASYMDTNRGLSLLNKLLTTTEKLDPHFLIILLNDSSLSQGIRTALSSICNKLSNSFSKNTEDNFLSLTLKMHLILAGFLTPTLDSLNSLISKLDDSRLYRYARSANLEISEQKTVNYTWHKIFQGDLTAADSLVQKCTSFEDIELIIKTTKEFTPNTPTLMILKEYIQGVTPTRLVEITEQMIKIYNENASFMNTKVLLSLLISSKNKSNLALALYIASQSAFEDNYEISLIELFICRYFCLVPEVLRKYEKLTIKNLQLYNNTYMWSDPLIISSKPTLYKNTQVKNAISLLKSQRSNDLSKIKESTVAFMSKNLVGQSVSLIKLYQEIKTSIVCKEVETNRILATSPKGMFSGLLGPGCAYLFSKATTDTNYHEDFCVPEGDQYVEILKNIHYMDIGEKFREYFRKCWEESK